mmetsp:Transcript_109993/g.164555  ORF Transcript_109993/g.164555 Transcript_109993/m.164555 type:complete len:403 (+) Transcript_109993:227-1435(+)
MTAPSTPAFCAMRKQGSSQALATILMPVRMSWFRFLSSSIGSSTIDARRSATPPPGTMPSSTAARVALRASTKRSLRSPTSTSDEPPTLITATPPDSFASRSCSFSFSYSEVVPSMVPRICSHLSLIASELPAPSSSTVSSLLTTTFFTEPRTEASALSSLRPRSSLISWAPVRIAMSCRFALRLSPKPGALTQTTLSPPRSLFTMKPASASLSTSSAITTSGFVCLAQWSRIWKTCWKALILPSTSSTAASSNSHFCVFASVMKYGEMYPRSNFIPSTHSSSSTMVLPSWMVMTPSLVTFSIASASSFPTSASPFAEIVATCPICSVPSTLTAIFPSSSVTAFTAASMPRRTSVGFMPAATALQPSRKMLLVKIVAEVVPSPAASLVLLATERTSCAPRLI